MEKDENRNENFDDEVEVDDDEDNDVDDCNDCDDCDDCDDDVVGDEPDNSDVHDGENESENQSNMKSLNEKSTINTTKRFVDESNITNTLNPSTTQEESPYLRILTNKNELESKNYTRDELVFLTKIYERAELYEEAVESSYLYIKMKPILSSDERMTFSNAFKNLLLLKRASLKSLEDQYKKEKKGKVPENITNLIQIIERVEDELNALIGLMLEIVDGYFYLIQKNQKHLFFI